MTTINARLQIKIRQYMQRFDDIKNLNITKSPIPGKRFRATFIKNAKEHGA